MEHIYPSGSIGKRIKAIDQDSVRLVILFDDDTFMKVYADQDDACRPFLSHGVALNEHELKRLGQ